VDPVLEDGGFDAAIILHQNHDVAAKDRFETEVAGIELEDAPVSGEVGEFAVKGSGFGENESSRGLEILDDGTAKTDFAIMDVDQ
jgi:hypothetical protein